MSRLGRTLTAIGIRDKIRSLVVALAALNLGACIAQFGHWPASRNALALLFVLCGVVALDVVVMGAVATAEMYRGFRDEWRRDRGEEGVDVRVDLAGADPDAVQTLLRQQADHERDRPHRQ